MMPGMMGGKLKPGWRKVKFGEVVRQVKEKADPETSGLERYVAGDHMDTDDLRIRRWGEIGSGYLGPAFHMRFRPGQVLYGSRRTYLRKVAIANFDGICANTTFVLEPKNAKELLPELLPFLMQTDAFNEFSVKNSKGSVNPYINFSDLARYEFALPPMEEQRRIVEILHCTEDTYRGLAEAEIRANTLLRALSVEEFSTPSSGKEMLASHYSIVSGQIDPREPSYCDLPLIAPNHIESKTGRVLKLESAASQVAISGKYLFEAGSVVYSKIRPNLVKATVAPCRGLCSADMYPLLPKPTIRNAYLLEILLSEEFTQFAVSGSMRTGIPKLNREHLIQYQCRVPPIDHQDKYLARVHEVRNAARALEARRASISNLKKQIFSEVW